MAKQQISRTLAYFVISLLAANLAASAADESKNGGSQAGSGGKLAKVKAAFTKKKDASEKGSEGKDKMAKATGLQVNDRAPDVSLPDQTGKIVSLGDYHGKKVVVLYFYPKDDTSVCTAEACTFRDSYDAFKDLGAEVIGVSADTVDSHKKFADKHHLQFHLLADTSGMARKAFGVPTTMKVLPGRVTYVIDKDGVIRYVFNSMMDGPKHVTEAMKIVKDLNAPSKS